MTCPTSQPGVIVVTDAAWAERLGRELAGHWPIGAMPALVSHAVRELIDDPARWPVNALAVVCAGHHDRGDLRALLKRAEGSGVPVVALVAPGSEAEPGTADAVILPANTPTPALAGVLWGVLQRQAAHDRLKRHLVLEQALKQAASRELARTQEEHELAVQLQRAFLPPVLPSTQDVVMARLFRPVGGLSGDIYDAALIDGHTLAFFVADACGHGLPAAMLTMLIGRTLPMKETVGLQAVPVPPGEALRRLNAQFMQRRSLDSALVTAMYGMMDVRDGTVLLAGAGHPAAACISGGQMRLIHSEGPAIGLFDDADFPHVRFTLQPGETLLLHTDGFEQAFVNEQDRHSRRRRPTELYRDAFVELFAHDAGEDLPAAMDAMADRLDQQHGSLHQIDDITLLAIARRASAARREDLPRREAA